MEIVFATHNPGKLQEMQALLPGHMVVGAEDAGVTEDAVEDADTFEGNALKKARFVAERTGKWSVADDSGLCIQALDGKPGVFSARWAGEGAGDDEIIDHTISQLKGVPRHKRQAYFISCLAMVSPTGDEYVFEGRIDGLLTTEPRGVHKQKLPYDSLFIPQGYSKTYAEMSAREKNSMSHRGRAFIKLKNYISTISI